MKKPNWKNTTWRLSASQKYRNILVNKTRGIVITSRCAGMMPVLIFILLPAT